MTRLKVAQKSDRQCFAMERRRRLTDRLHLLVRQPLSRADDCNFKLFAGSPSQTDSLQTVCPLTSAQIITFHSDFYSSTLRPRQARSGAEEGGEKGRDRTKNTWFSLWGEEQDEEKMSWTFVLGCWRFLHNVFFYFFLELERQKVGWIIASLIRRLKCAARPHVSDVLKEFFGLALC